MLDHRDQLCSLLEQLEAELRRLELWSEQPPAAAALRSTLPFCTDTLDFEAWLQWVFIPQMRQLLAVDAPLPRACAIAPMVELSFRDRELRTVGLQQVLVSIDELVVAHGGHRH
jgi:uncharacterized protein YqcC (DUF446 family)